jgi:hypothetical protein
MIKILIEKLKTLRLYFVINCCSKKEDDFRDIIQENERHKKAIDKFEGGF